MPRPSSRSPAKTPLAALARMLLSSGLLALAALGGCAIPSDDGQQEACEIGVQSSKPQDSEEVGTAQEELSSHSCALSKATGYKSGKAFDIDVVTIDGKKVEWQTANAYLRMAAAAAKDGVQIRIVSGFRSMPEQHVLYQCYRTCSCNNCNHASVPGYSNHQSGHALDLNASAPGVFSWLTKHAGEFGFKGFSDENWHWEWWGTDPGTGPCNGGTLKAKVTKLWSNAERHRGKGADYAVCAGAPFAISFTLENKGAVTWRDVDGRGAAVGSDVFLVTANGQRDELTGKKRFSVRLNKNRWVRGDRKAKDCSSKNGCRRTTFVEGAIRATAPQAPGVYETRWRLRDYSKAWGKHSKGFGPKVELRVKVVACEQPKQECGCRVWCSDAKTQKLTASIDSESMCKSVAQTYCQPAGYLEHAFQACAPAGADGSGGTGGTAGQPSEETGGAGSSDNPATGGAPAAGGDTSAGGAPPAGPDPNAPESPSASPGGDNASGGGDAGDEDDDNGLTPVDDAEDGVGSDEPDDPDFVDDGYPGYDELPSGSEDEGGSCSVSSPGSSTPSGLALLLLLGAAWLRRPKAA